MRVAWSRCAAGVAAITALAGGVAVVIALAALPHPWTGGYVSEAGVATDPRAALYRIGILGVAVSLVLLGIVLFHAVRVAAALLAVAGVLASISASVPCTAGCPLPPYERTTPMDLVHAGASTAAVGFAALAMGVTAMTVDRADRWLYRAAQIGFGLVAPMLAGLAVGLLAVGRGELTAVLERAALGTLLIWLTTTAGHSARRVTR